MTTFCDTDYELLAEQAAGNHRDFRCFAWFERPDDSENWTLVYTSNRDSDILDKANAQVIASELARYIKSGHVIEQRHSHWAVGHVDGYAIRVYTKCGRITAAFKVWCDIQARIQDYPILDESLYSELEQEEIDESWGCWIRYDFKRELQLAFNVEIDADSDQLWEVFHNACEKSGRYPEHTGSEVVVDMDLIVAAVTLDQIRALVAGGAE